MRNTILLTAVRHLIAVLAQTPALIDHPLPPTEITRLDGAIMRQRVEVPIVVQKAPTPETTHLPPTRCNSTTALRWKGMFLIPVLAMCAMVMAFVLVLVLEMPGMVVMLLPCHHPVLAAVIRDRCPDQAKRQRPCDPFCHVIVSGTSRGSCHPGHGQSRGKNDRDKSAMRHVRSFPVLMGHVIPPMPMAR